MIDYLTYNDLKQIYANSTTERYGWAFSQNATSHRKTIDLPLWDALRASGGYYNVQYRINTDYNFKIKIIRCETNDSEYIAYRIDNVIMGYATDDASDAVALTSIDKLDEVMMTLKMKLG